jgi:hypothetical protein
LRGIKDFVLIHTAAFIAVDIDQTKIQPGPRKIRTGSDTRGHQPEGLADSSRWLKRSENHRNKFKKELYPEGVRESQTISGMPFSSGTPSGCGRPTALTGGLRFAMTTGYFLATLRVGLLHFKLEFTTHHLSLNSYPRIKPPVNRICQHICHDVSNANDQHATLNYAIVAFADSVLNQE